MNSPDPRLLVVSANKWSTAGQIASALRLVGFEVAVVCPIGSPACCLRKLRARFPFRSRLSPAFLRSTIDAWSPDILIVADDLAAQALMSLYSEASGKSADPDSAKLLALLEFSFGSPRNFAISQSRNEILSLAASLGVNCPKTTALTNGLDFADKTLGTSFPAIVKTDDGWGGVGVRIVNDRSELSAATAELSLPYHWPKDLKHVLGRSIPPRFLRWAIGQPRKLSIQEFIQGRPCTHAAVCWKGKVLGSITVDVMATLYEFGPAAVVKIFHHEDIELAAEKIVAALGLSGFLGFDFMLDPAGNSWFLEMNPRTTPICHLATKDHDLVSAFYNQVAERKSKTFRSIVDDDAAFTLFPYGGSRALPLKLPNEKGMPPGEEAEYIEFCRIQELAEVRNWLWYQTFKEPENKDNSISNGV